MKTLKLGNNPIHTIDELKRLLPLKNLRYLDLEDCPVEKKNKNIKEIVFEIFPDLKSYNGYGMDGESVYSMDDDECGEYEEDEDDYEDDEDEDEEGEEEEDFENSEDSKE